MNQYGDMIPPGATLEKVFGGCAFGEGPAADADGNVYFSDCPNNRILVYRPDSGQTDVWQEPSGRANGMNFDAEGRLVVCCDGKDGGARAVQRYEPDGSATTLASHYNGKLLNAPNDLCFDQAGRIYFTDPRYGWKEDLEQDCMAVYRLDLDGSLTRVIDDLEYPNGILITPDNKTLYLVDHNPEPGGARTLVAYDLDPAGNWNQRAVFHDFGDGYGGDGMVLDVGGNIYLAAGEDEQAGIYIFSAEGEQVGFIPVPEIPGNCTFGGPDLQTLYIAASASLYRIKLLIPGAARLSALVTVCRAVRNVRTPSLSKILAAKFNFDTRLNGRGDANGHQCIIGDQFLEEFDRAFGIATRMKI